MKTCILYGVTYRTIIIEGSKKKRKIQNSLSTRNKNAKTYVHKKMGVQIYSYSIIGCGCGKGGDTFCSLGQEKMKKKTKTPICEAPSL